MKKMMTIFACMAVAVTVWLGSPVGASAGETLRCASTTSTQNSGLFEYLLPLFEKESGITVQVIAVGTGAALELGKRGDVDLVFVHAKKLELEMLAAGWFIERQDVMYNDFILVGPTADPAAAGKAKGANGALGAIGKSGRPFVSRGDDSGTHKKELALWQQNGSVPDPATEKWYLAVGQGMAKTIRIAGEKQGYTLTDRGTWLAMQDQAQLGLAVVFEGDPVLFNQYGVMAVNPAKHPQVKIAAVRQFIAWLTGKSGQAAINNFKDQQGHALFIANAVAPGKGQPVAAR